MLNVEPLLPTCDLVLSIHGESEISFRLHEDSAVFRCPQEWKLWSTFELSVRIIQVIRNRKLLKSRLKAQLLLLHCLSCSSSSLRLSSTISGISGWIIFFLVDGDGEETKGRSMKEHKRLLFQIKLLRQLPQRESDRLSTRTNYRCYSSWPFHSLTLMDIFCYCYLNN
ncbi:hypothetical protein L6164_010191 [Bauhinia variegata]|uniref:Uncharacterized protein n=1 Tax=Bauhinia variegata TaxID=167791 RepID=A0ACB9PMJ9_BAUVA|nr:hypothetical protein L6164_010191 [Bauhinia variegata]